MRLGLGTASLLSFLIIVEAAAISGIIAGGLLQIPVVDPRVMAIIATGAGAMLAFFILHKSYS